MGITSENRRRIKRSRRLRLRAPVGTSVVLNHRWRRDAPDPKYHLVDITIPFGFAAFRIASYALWPFGRTIVEKPGPRPGAVIGNVIWVILFGIWLAIGHIVTAVAMAITIIGIPLALANLKLIPVSLVPLGKEIVPVDSLKNPVRAAA